jgi:hypothetical protein
MFFRNKNAPVYNTLIHILVWTAILLLPFLFERRHEFGESIEIIRGPWLPILLSIVCFYINYFFLIPRFLLRKRNGYYFLFNLLLIILVVFIMESLRSFDLFSPMNDFPDHGPPPFDDRPMPPEFEGNMMISHYRLMIMDAMVMILAIIFSITVRITQKWIRTENEKQEIEKKNAQSSLMLLKYQLQPHFFFNSLNNIYALIESSPHKAQEALHDLGKLMRYLLYGKEQVELSQEVAFLKQYIDLMELRLRPDIKTRVTLPEETGLLKIAPLLFVPLIENAYKHGISSLEPSYVFIDMQLEGNRINFVTENTNFPKSSSDKSGSGIGLQNLKQRLELLYPGKYQFEQIVSDGVFRTTLIIDLDNQS